MQLPLVPSLGNLVYETGILRAKVFRLFFFKFHILIDTKSHRRLETQFRMLPGLSAKPPKVMSHALTSWEINADSSSLVPGPWRLGRDKALGKAPTLPTGEVEVCETKLEEKAL